MGTRLVLFRWNEAHMILGCLLWMLSEAALDVYRLRIKNSQWWKWSTVRVPPPPAPPDLTPVQKQHSEISEAWMAYRQLYRAYHTTSGNLMSDIEPHVLQPWTGRNYDNEALTPLTVKVKG